jgi:predicted nucleic acid-binding Zn ribbon protein
VTRPPDDGKLIHIRDILSSALEKYRPAGDTDMTRIWDIWETAVGQVIALNAKPRAFRDGVLITQLFVDPSAQISGKTGGRQYQLAPGPATGPADPVQDWQHTRLILCSTRP